MRKVIINLDLTVFLWPIRGTSENSDSIYHHRKTVDLCTTREKKK